LAAAAYNAGEARVAKAVRRYGTKDFWTLARHRYLRPETRDYVPKIIAAALIAKNRDQFGFDAGSSVPDSGMAISPAGELVKLESGDEPVAVPNTGTTANRGPITEKITAPTRRALKEILTEEDYETVSELDLAPDHEGSLADGAVALPEVASFAGAIPTPTVSRKGDVHGVELAEFTVQSPADLLKVARASGLSYQTVKSLNPELLRWCTPPQGSSYRIKLPSQVKDRFLVTYNHSAFPRKVQFLAHRVRRGETLTRIASRFGIKVDPLTELNGVSPKVPLRSGLNVLLPIPNDRSRNMASLEIRDPPERRRSKRRRFRRRAEIGVETRRKAAARARPVFTSRGHRVDS
jgi:membrane-bound lytic murein transglycosylase D